MNRKPFHFKQFSIHHDRCAMKIGTDGVLLGAWTPLHAAKNILDIGTGTGVIAIMLAQRSQVNVVIDAIEIDQAAYDQAKENINNCKWSHQITALHSPLQNFSKSHAEKYDLIVSNPPFFLQGSKPLIENRKQARHADTLSHDDLITHSKYMLKETGLLSIILPFEEGTNFIRAAKNLGLYCQHYVAVKPKINKPVERLLLSFSKSQPIEMIKEKLTIQYEQRNDYTPEYTMLTKDFYTIM